MDWKIYRLIALTIVLLSLPPASLAAACEDVFSNVVGTTGGKLELKKDANLNNTGGAILATDNLKTEDPNNYCDGGACTASGTPAPPLILPGNSSNTDYNGSPLNFTAGDYYFKKFQLGKNQVLTVSSGPVRIHVRDKMTIDESALVNVPGDYRDLIFIVEKDIEIKKNAQINAILFSESKVKIKENVQLTGAVTGNEVTVDKNADLTFGPVTGVDFNGACTSTPATPASPIAEFRLDEFSVDGTVGELADSQGNFNAARALGTGSGVASVDAKVCKGVTVPNNTSSASRWAVDTGVDIDDDVGSRGSVSFWYKSNSNWIGGGDRKLLDASQEDTGNINVDKYFYLSLTNSGRLEFGGEDTADSNMFAQTASQSIAAGTWTHIALTWDYPGRSFKIYIDGSLAGSGSNANTGTIGELQTLYVGDNRGAYIYGGTFNSANGEVDELRIYDSAIDTTTITRDIAVTRTCASPVVDPDGFNCVVAGADALSGRLYLQKVGTAFTFDVAALEDSDSNGSMDAVETGFASSADRSVTLELVDTSGGATCGARPVLSPAVSQTLTFSAADAGRKAAAAMTVNKAYRSVGCRVTDSAANPVVVACSTDSFSIRPTALSLSPPTLNNSGSSGAPMQAAGSNFSLSVSASVGYDGTPLVDSTKLGAHAGAVATGTLGGVFSAAAPATGVASGSGFSYSEVGNFRFAAQGLYDAGFSAVDQPGDCTDDFSNTAVGGKYGCKFGNTSDSSWVGRFTPDHFTAAVSSVGSLDNTCVAGGFSYQGEQVAFATDPSIRVSARNTGGNLTQNYTGAYAKLSSASFTFAAVSGDGTALGVDGVTPVSVAWTAGTLGLADNGDGTHDLTLSGDRFVWGRAGNDQIAPFSTDLELNLSTISDADSVAGNGLPLLVEPTGVDMRYGRLGLTNAHGSELQDLGLPMQVEQYQGAATGFVVNAADSCTNVSGLVLTDLNAGDGLLPAETCIWDDANVTGLGCVGPGPLASQYAATPLAGGFNLNLKAPGANNSGVLGVSADAPTWLEFDWTGTGDSDPSARATFGIFNRNTSIIYQRELR